MNKELALIRKLHRMVIHRRKGTTKEYFTESKKIQSINDSQQLRYICTKCFPLKTRKGGQ